MASGCDSGTEMFLAFGNVKMGWGTGGAAPAASEAGSSRSSLWRLYGRFAGRPRSHGGTDLRARSND